MAVITIISSISINMKNRKIRVLQITHDLDLGGLQRVIVNICRTIDRSKFDISVLCLRNLGCFLPEVNSLKIPVTLIPQKKQGVDYLSFLKVAAYLRKNKPDVIHTHNTQPFIDGTIAALLTGVKKIVHTDHARSFPDKKRYMFAERLMSYFAYKVVGVSEHTSNNLVKYEHIRPSKIITIPNGIDPAPYQVEYDKKKFRMELGLLQDGPIIGVAVRLSEQKGITYLLQAMPQIISQFPDVSLIIAGDGPLKDDLISETKHLNISRNVFFLGTRLDIPKLLKLFDIYVLPSLWEGLPMIILEAMAAECAVVATNVGGVQSAIKDGETGLIVNSKSDAELGDAVCKLLTNTNLKNKITKQALSLFQNQFSSECMTKRYSALYSNNQVN